MIYLTDKLAVTADGECYMVGRPRQRAGRAVSVDNPRYYRSFVQEIRMEAEEMARKFRKHET